MRHSCGFILIRSSSNSAGYQYLLQCRRDTIPYLVFLQGRYDGTKHALETLWRGMTRDEHRRLQTGSFRELFCTARIHAECWELGQKMYQRHAHTLHTFSEDDGWETPEWGFPKGRKNHPKESDRACALRELVEETGLREEHIRVLEIPPVRERFRGSDQKLYTCDYYIAEALVDPTLQPCPPDDPEVSALRWFTFEEALLQFRPWESYRRDTLQHVHQLLMAQKRMHEPTSK